MAYCTSIAGTGAKGASGDGGPATSATFNGIHNFVVTREGDLLLADSFNSLLRRIDAHTGLITTLAGSMKKGFAGDGGPAKDAAVFHAHPDRARPGWAAALRRGHRQPPHSPHRPGKGRPSRPSRATGRPVSRPMAPRRSTRRWSIRGRSRRTPRADSTSWNGMEMRCVTLIQQAGSKRWSAPGQRA